MQESKPRFCLGLKAVVSRGSAPGTRVPERLRRPMSVRMGSVATMRRSQREEVGPGGESGFRSKVGKGRVDRMPCYVCRG